MYRGLSVIAMAPVLDEELKIGAVVRRTPRDVVDRLHRETLKALQEPKVRDKLAGMGFEPMVMTSAEFAAHVEQEIRLNAALVKATGIKSH